MLWICFFTKLQINEQNFKKRRVKPQKNWGWGKTLDKQKLQMIYTKKMNKGRGFFCWLREGARRHSLRVEYLGLDGYFEEGKHISRICTELEEFGVSRDRRAKFV